MEQTKYLKIGSFLLFLIAAGYSCWATAHSLHLLMPQIPYLLVWGITIAFFIVASYATKMIVDSLNQNIYQENPRGKLIGGIILLLIFWLVCSMPTNAHTFFYNQKIRDVVTQDINTTRGYLYQLATLKVTLPKYDTIEAEVGALSEKMTDEFNGLGKSSGRTGNGKYVMEYMTKINSKLGSNIPIDPRFNAYNGDILNRYNYAISQALSIKKREYQTQQDDLARSMYDDLEVMLDTINATTDIEEDIIRQTEDVLQGAYALIKSNQIYVEFEPNDVELYTADNIVTRTKRLLSVFDVWIDFIKGRYAGSGFFFWIVISILVDVAAFLFFDFTFKKEE